MSDISPLINERAEREFNDALAGKYFDIWDTYPIQRYTDMVEQQLLSTVVQPKSRVLVLGVGGGRELPALLEKACEIVAVDLSPEMLRIGRERYGTATIEWREANVSALPDDLRGFACAIALGGVMNYQLDLTETLRHLWHRLDPSGFLVFDSFNREFPGEREEHQAKGRIRRSYSLSDLTERCRDAGFEDIEIKGHRFLADQLDAGCNRDVDHPGRETLRQLLELESQLHFAMPPERAKLLICIVRKTRT